MYSSKEKISPLGQQIAIFVLLSIALILAGWLNYQDQEHTFKNKVQDDLNFINRIKSDQISSWRQERLGDGGDLYNSPLLSNAVNDWLKNPKNLDLKFDLIKRLASLPKNYFDYQNVFLVDKNGKVLLSGLPHLRPLAPVAREQAAKCWQAKRPFFADLYRDESGIWLDIFVPILSPENRQTEAAAILRINPYHTLYPMLQSWPVPSRSGEVLMVQREGNQVLFLNELRFQKNTALSLHLPLSRENLPAAMAVAGKTGAVEGIDYRDIPVLSAIGRIPDSPWFLVTKIDQSEVYAPLMAMAWQTSLAVLVLLLLGGFALGGSFAFRQRLADRKIRQSEEKFRSIFQTAANLIISVNREGKIVDCNNRSVELLGYESPELLGQPMTKIYHPDDLEKALGFFNELIEIGITYNKEYRLIGKDGRVIDVSVNSATIKDATGNFDRTVCIFDDITERNRSQQRILQLNSLLKAIRNVNQLIVTERVPETLLEKTCQTLLENRGYKACWIGKKQEDFSIRPLAWAGLEHNHLEALAVSWDEEPSGQGPSGIAIRTGLPSVTRDLKRIAEFAPDQDIVGLLRLVSAASVPIKIDEEIFGVIGVFSDQAEAFDQEEIELLDELAGDLGVALKLARTEENQYRTLEDLKYNEEKFRQIFNNASDIIFLSGLTAQKLPGKFVEVNDTACQILGYSREELLLTSPYDIIAQESREFFPQVGHQLNKDGHANYFMYLQSKSGRQIPFELEAHLFELQGQPMVITLGRDISARKKSDELLRIEKDRIKRYLDIAGVLIVVLNQKGEVDLINKKGCDILGLACEEIVGKNWFDNFVPQHIRALVKQTFKKIISKEIDSPEYYENPILTAGGEERLIGFHNTVLYDDNEKVIGTLSSGEDITVRMQIENALKDSEVSYRRLFETAKDGILLLDGKTGKIVDANPYILDMTKYTLPEIIGKQLWEIGFIKDKELAKSAFEKLQKESYVRYEDLPLQTKDGQTLEVEFVSNAYDVDHRRIIQCNIRDITERRRLYAGLQESEERYRQLLENMPDIVFVLDLKGNFRFVNSQAEKITGYPRSRILEMNIKNFVRPEDISRVKELLTRNMKGEKLPPSEFEIKTADNRSLLIQVITTPLRTAKGDLIGVQGIARDLSDARVWSKS